MACCQCVHIDMYVVYERLCDVISLLLQIEQMYRDAHAKIRADPSFTKKAKREGIKKKRFVFGTCKIKCIKTLPSKNTLVSNM